MAASSGGPLIAGTLGEKVGWHWGSAPPRRHADRPEYLFVGRKYLPPDSPVVEEKQAKRESHRQSKLTRRA